jgi:hypothetical protein
MLSWNDIRDRATRFARDWGEETREMGEYQTFWNDFFDVFGVSRRTVARYQEHVRDLDGKHGFIDLFWPGTLIAEHKTRGQNLDAAYNQAAGYFDSLSEEKRPRYIVTTDYQTIQLYDFEGEGGIEKHIFPLKDFPKNIRLFGFIPGYKERKYKEEDPVNRKAVKIVVGLYRALNNGNYPKEYLSRLMVRLVFCFFADDTGIFGKKDILVEYFQYMTREDGADFGAHLEQIFQILDTPEKDRQANLDADLATLPYVNGGLFRDHLPLPSFNREMRGELIKGASFDWGSVSPAIFGSMFQFVLDADNETIRHDFGAHYTSEKNILKVISGLFLDDLKEELEAAGQNTAKLNVLWDRIANISLLDPACGCGNFLVVAYRELRELELEILKRLYRKDLEPGQMRLDLDMNTLSKFSVERMYGIELLSFPAEIAQLSLWLTDHQMNTRLGALFGRYFAKLPLTEHPHITTGNALRIDWGTVVPKEKLTYILGNPPFIAKQDRDMDQKMDMQEVFGDLKGLGELDYVAAWYVRAAEYMFGSNIRSAFVSTNSIAQGEQVSILWGKLLSMGVRINFAHRTFRWSNDAPGKAAVHCVIVGFSMTETRGLKLWDYEHIGGDPHMILARNINPYLVDADNLVITARKSHLEDVPAIHFGSMPNDGGNLLFDDKATKSDFLMKEPSAEKFIRPFISAKEYLNGEMRFCLWLKGVPPEEWRKLSRVLERIEAVKKYRSSSKRDATRKLAKTPYLFAEDRQPSSDYILIPRVSSEKRKYIPMDIFSANDIAGDTCVIVPDATSYHFGILQSLMHMAWTRAVCGRLKSDYRYSNELVYNNFPWPENPSGEQKKAVEDAAQAVLEARKNHIGATLADLYDPLTMPVDLLKAHQQLDRAVDHCYGKRSFGSEPERLEFLFERYKELVEKEGGKKKNSEKTRKNKV